MGVFAKKEGNLLIRHKVHYFVKCLEGVVTVFEKYEDKEIFGGEAIDVNRIWISTYQGMDNANRTSFFVEESDEEYITPI